MPIVELRVRSATGEIEQCEYWYPPRDTWWQRIFANAFLWTRLVYRTVKIYCTQTEEEIKRDWEASRNYEFRQPGGRWYAGNDEWMSE